MGKKQVPAIRFQGFTDAWEQRKLSEITDKVTEKNAGLQYVETFTNSAEFGIISQRDFFDHDIAKLGSLDGYYIVKDEDFVYNPRISTSAPVGPINRNKLGRTGVMSPLYTVFRPHDIDTTYLEHFFKCDYWHSFMNFNGDSGARSDRFSIRDNVFFQMPIPIPDIDEQRKIGELLTCLDHLITLHQRKYEKLLKVKKSMLEKMFPRDGADVPEIRFDGFTDAWEQRKLGDIYIERNERGNAELDILSVSIHHGISQNELDTDELGKSVRRSDDKSLYKHVYYGDLVFNMMRAWQGAIGVVKNEGMVSPAYISAIPDDSVFPEFMDYCLRRKCIINQINNLSYGVTDFRKRLYWEPFTRVTIMMPSVDEQRKITDIFRQLDNLITLHQRKLEKLKNIKKSLLEKMFV